MTKEFVKEYSYVDWLDGEVVDVSFLDDLPLIPEKINQSIMDSMVESATDLLFEFESPHPWALFTPFEGYNTFVKKLFKRRVASVNIPSSIDRAISSEGDGKSTVINMLETLEKLDDILETIYLDIFSTLKP